MKNRKDFINEMIKKDDLGLFDLIIRNTEKRITFNKTVLKILSENRGLIQEGVEFIAFENKGSNNYRQFVEIKASETFELHPNNVKCFAKDRDLGNNHISFESFIFSKLPLSVLRLVVNDFRDSWRMSSNIFNHFDEKDTPMSIELDLEDSSAEEYELADIGPEKSAEVKTPLGDSLEKYTAIDDEPYSFAKFESKEKEKGGIKPKEMIGIEKSMKEKESHYFYPARKIRANVDRYGYGSLTSSGGVASSGSIVTPNYPLNLPDYPEPNFPDYPETKPSEKL